MESVDESAYDPIFYIHHAYVDHIYAYWQQLQTLRGIVLHSTEESADRRMPPFSGISTTDESGGSSVPNPFELTRRFSTQQQGLNYERNFGYRYDQLLFDGRTPEQFIANEQELCANRAQVTVDLQDAEIGSVNELFVQGFPESFGRINNFGFSSPSSRRKRRKNLNVDIIEEMKNRHRFRMFTAGNREAGQENSGHKKSRELTLDVTSVYKGWGHLLSLIPEFPPPKL